MDGTSMDNDQGKSEKSETNETPGTQETISNGGESSTQNPSTEDEEVRNFGNRSILVTASRMGISMLSEEICQQIAQEAYLKTKELLFRANVILNKNKDNKLTIDDVNKAMKLTGGVEIFGHHSQEESNFIPIPRADIYIEDDPEIDIYEIAISDPTFTPSGESYMQGSWVLPEKSSETPTKQHISPYYVQIAKTLLLGKDVHRRVALMDLRTNPKIGAECPYFLNLVALTIKKAPQNIQLTNAMIGAVDAIVNNKFVEPSPYLGVNRAVNSLLKIVIDVEVDSKCDDISTRTKAGLLMAKVVTAWGIELKQQIDIVKHLLEYLLHTSLPFQSHYGAIVALTALSQRMLDFYFWPVMERYLPQLETRMVATPNVLSQYVMIAVLVAARSTISKKTHPGKEQLQKLLKVDRMLYYCFGDSVIPLRIAFCLVGNEFRHLYHYRSVKPLKKPLTVFEITDMDNEQVKKPKTPLPLSSVFNLVEFKQTRRKISNELTETVVDSRKRRYIRKKRFRSTNKFDSEVSGDMTLFL